MTWSLRVFSDFESSPLASALTCGVVAHYACCCADTFASELGVLSARDPVLVTNPFRTVPRGTNGGVTWSGFVLSALGGAIVGSSLVVLDHVSGIPVRRPWRVCVFGSACGFVGSLVDSLLGATLQSTTYDDEKRRIRSEESIRNEPGSTHISGWNVLSNAQVNLVSVLITTYLGATIFGPMFFA